jgi:hypothetical protein
MPYVLTDDAHRGLQQGLAALQQNLGAAQQNAGALSALLAQLPPAELAAPPAAAEGRHEPSALELGAAARKAAPV